MDAGNGDDGRPPTHPRTLLLVNGHIEVALGCGADGVHLPEAMIDTHATELRKTQAVEGSGERRRLVVGGSVHSVVRGACAVGLGFFLTVSLRTRHK